MKIYLYFFLLFFPICGYCQQHSFLGINIAKDELKSALSTRKNKNTAFRRAIVGDKETAISIAEAILFKIYSKKQILSERPYEVYLINGYWVLSGTLPDGWDGGGF